MDERDNDGKHDGDEYRHDGEHDGNEYRHDGKRDRNECDDGEHDRDERDDGRGTDHPAVGLTVSLPTKPIFTIGVKKRKEFFNALVFCQEIWYTE